MIRRNLNLLLVLWYHCWNELFHRVQFSSSSWVKTVGVGIQTKVQSTVGLEAQLWYMCDEKNVWRRMSFAVQYSSSSWVKTVGVGMKTKVESKVTLEAELWCRISTQHNVCCAQHKECLVKIVGMENMACDSPQS